MIWLASYPRSGNTFFRILLDEVYGIPSASFDVYNPKAVTPDYQNFQVVKTHVLPEQLAPKDDSIPAVYLIRDGRDAVVSMAHHRADIVAPGTDFTKNLVDAIRARNGSQFGGWSKHVRLWTRRASIVIRFEDLIQSPVECVERIRPWLKLPSPKLEKVPTFSDLKSPEFQFDKSPFIAWAPPKIRSNFFRKGKIGAWKEEMPRWMQWLFYVYHGKALREMGYEDRNWFRVAFGNAA